VVEVASGLVRETSRAAEPELAAGADISLFHSACYQDHVASGGGPRHLSA
jgi:hypothetical protein